MKVLKEEGNPLIEKIHRIEEFLREESVFIDIIETNLLLLNIDGYILCVKNSPFPRKLEEDRIYVYNS